MALGYRYTLERQHDGWWLVRFPGIPEALTEGETKEEVRVNARDCVVTALEGYMKAGRPLPRASAGYSGPDQAVLPSLVTAKLAVYETMRVRGWSEVRLAKELGISRAGLIMKVEKYGLDKRRIPRPGQLGGGEAA